VKYNKQITL